MFAPDWAAGEGPARHRGAQRCRLGRGTEVAGLTLEIVRLPGRTPVLFFGWRPAGPVTQTVLMYGHLDKAARVRGLAQDLGPWTPLYEDGKLYGRGGADDSYAVYANIAAVQRAAAPGRAAPRIVGLIETCEESGSADLLPTIDALRPRLGDVGLVVCLDSGAGSYDQLWLTTSLRGMASGTLKVEILTEACHSGDASGPGAVELSHHAPGARPAGTARTGRLLPGLSLRRCRRPAWPRRSHRRHPGRRGVPSLSLGACGLRRLPHLCLPTTQDPVQGAAPHLGTDPQRDRCRRLSHAATTRATMLRPYTAFKLSLRLPPLVDAATCVQNSRPARDNAPYRAKVTWAWKAPRAGTRRTPAMV